MSDLLEFLKARFDEDERYARTEVGAPLNSPQGGDSLVTDSDVTPSMRFIDTPGQGGFTVYYDPARVLREVEAKRRMLEEHPCDDEGFCGDGIGLVGCKWAWPCPTIRLLALPYANHPDYRQEWRP